MSGTVSKIASERNQKALLELAIKPGNGEYRLYPDPDHRAWVALYRFFCLCGSMIILSGDGMAFPWQTSLCQALLVNFQPLYNH
jgi:hypothetical protein